MFGKTTERSESVRPNQRASVPAYCSTPVVGSQRPLGFEPRQCRRVRRVEIREKVAASVRSCASVDVAARYCSAEDEHIISPGVIGADSAACSCRIHCASEIRKRELRYLILHSLHAHFIVERTHRLT